MRLSSMIAKLAVALTLCAGTTALFAAGGGEGGGAAAGATVTGSEAPMLAAMVADGTLPPLQDRLPENPMVVQVVDEIGKYGGELRRIYTSARDHCNYSRPVREGLTRYSVDGLTLVPALAERWESSPDGREWTMFIRKGVKWSDGAPLTGEDFRYRFEVLMNEELTPAVPAWLRAGADVGTVTVVDDFTIKFSFGNPNWIFPNAVSEEPCASGGSGYAFTPAHFMQQFHKDYAGAEAVEALMKEGGFDSYFSLYDTKKSEKWTPERPTTRAWQLQNEFGAQLLIAERNPYFYGVDPAGNQLPYIDRMTWQLVEDAQVIQVKFAQGEADFQFRHVQFQSFPVLKQNEDRVGYRVLTWRPIGVTADTALFMNQTFEGPEGDILRNKSVRQALSIAIDRDEMNEIVYLGLGEKRQAVPAAGHPHSCGEECVKRYTDYDPDRASAMLDQVIPNRDGDGFRTLPDGSRLQLVFTIRPPQADVGELVQRYWQAVGVRTKVDAVVRATLETRNAGNEFHVILWGVDTGCCLFTAPGKTVAVQPTHLPTWGPAYARWWETSGADGTEPPARVKRIQDLWAEGTVATPEEGNSIAQEIYDMSAEDLYIIGVLGLVPQLGVVHKDLGNVPDQAASDWPLRGPSTAFPEQFFWTNL